VKRGHYAPRLAVVAAVAAIMLTSTASAQGNLGGINRRVSTPPEDGLRITHVEAVRYSGYQPLDLLVDVADTSGAPAERVKVRADLNNPAGLSGITLVELGNGRYMACDVAYLDGPIGRTSITFRAERGREQSPEVTVVDSWGNNCGEGSPQLIASEPKAVKPDGPKMPLYVVVNVTDDGGHAIKGAKVLARATDYCDYAQDYLDDLGDGQYGKCGLGYFSTSGDGKIGVHVLVEKDGYRTTSNSSSNVVGSDCGSPIGVPQDENGGQGDER
jgi:hypothetical protein